MWAEVAGGTNSMCQHVWRDAWCDTARLRCELENALRAHILRPVFVNCITVKYTREPKGRWQVDNDGVTDVHG